MRHLYSNFIVSFLFLFISYSAISQESTNCTVSAVCQDLTVYLNADGVASIMAQDIDNGSTADCGIASMTLSQSTFDCDDVGASGGGTIIADLFISEYIEGGGNNKCIEIYNGTGSSIDLSANNYRLERYSNGSTSGVEIPLTGIIADGEVYVVCNSSASSSFTNQANITDGQLNFNGDDAVALVKNGTRIDIFGSIGEDPGSFWSGNGIRTQNRTLVRHPDVTEGVISNAAGFPSLVNEWIEYPQDTSTFLGSHDININGGSNGIPVTLTVTDSQGNTSMCTANVTVLDELAPETECLSDIIKNSDANSCGAVVNYTVTNSDNCGVDTVEQTEGIASGSLFPIGTTTNTFVITDINGNSSTCSFNVTIEDNELPSVVCQDITVFLDANGEAIISAQDIDNGSSDNCGIDTISLDRTTFNCNDVSESDGANLSHDLFISEYVEGGGNNKCIEIYNGTGADVDLSAGNYELARYTNGSTSPNLISLSGVLADGDVFVVCNSRANSGFTSQADILTGSMTHNGDDAIALLKGGIALDIFGRIGQDPGSEWNQNGNSTKDQTLVRAPFVTDGNTDNTVGFPALGTEWIAYPKDDSSQIGSHTITGGNSSGVEVVLTVTDINGNSNSCTATVTVVDILEPETTCVMDLTRETEVGECNYMVYGTEFDATASDNCTTITVTNNLNGTDSIAGEILPVGNTTVIWTMNDGSQETVFCTSVITIEDNQSPTVVCQDITVYLDANGQASIAPEDLDNGSFDNCGIDTLVLDRSTFDCSDVVMEGTVTPSNDLFISEYIEGSGNNKCIEIYNGTGETVNLSTAGYSIQVFFNGNTYASQTIDLQGSVADGEVFVICNSSASSAFTSLADQEDGGLQFNGDDAVVLRNGNTYIDVFGRIGQDPGSSWNQGGNSTINKTLVRASHITDGNIDNVYGFPSLGSEWIQKIEDDSSNLGSHTVEGSSSTGIEVTLIVTDVNGNSDSCLAYVTVLDNMEPIINCVESGIRNTDPGQCNYTIQGAELDATFTDNCEGGSISNSLNGTASIAGEVLQKGTTVVTWTAVDASGLTATCTTEITVEDNEEPVLSCVANAIRDTDVGKCDYTVQGTEFDAEFRDNCGDVSITNDLNGTASLENEVLAQGDTVVTWTVDDGNGQIVSCTTTITVIDNEAPIVSCMDFQVTLDANGLASITPEDIDNASTDNCGIATYEVSPSSFSCANIGDNTVTLTITDTNGNIETCTAIVTVNGIMPSVTISESELPEFCQGAVLELTANSDEAISYLWNNGESTQTIEVSGNGTYGVTVTSATNCTAYVEYTVTEFDPGALTSSYTIIATEEVELKDGTIVQSGGVGVTDGRGEIEVKKNSQIDDFAQATRIEIQQNSSVTNAIYQPANPTIPNFLYNNESDKNSPDVTVDSYQTQTLTGSVYDKIELKKGATAIFTQSNVYINELKTKKDVTIEFEGCTNLFINEDLKFEERTLFNSYGYMVTIYVDDDVDVKKESSINARIHANDNEIKVKGKNGRNSVPTYMTGLFIAEEVKADKNVIWNADTICSPCAVIDTNDHSDQDNDQDDEDDDLKKNSSVVKTWPNPSDNYFKLKYKTENYKDRVSIHVYDLNNKLVHKGDFNPKDVYIFGEDLDGGAYIVKLTQVGKTEYTKVIKF